MDTATVEKRAAVEFRYDGRTLTGPAVTYGDIATGPKGPERFEPRAFVSGVERAGLVLQHDRQRVIATQPDTLSFDDTALALDLRAVLRPDGAESRLIRRGVLQGLSVGFVAIDERQDAGVRVIGRAHLDHVALVDRPAYPGSTVELRQAFDRVWLDARIPVTQQLKCVCQGPTCDTVVFQPGAFDAIGDAAGDVLAVGGGGFANVLGSLRRGTLLLDRTRQGLRVGLTSRDTETARRVVESARVAPVYARPILDLDQSEYVQEGTVRTFERAAVRAILIKPTPNDQGHVPARIDGVENRRRIWL